MWEIVLGGVLQMRFGLRNGLVVVGRFSASPGIPRGSCAGWWGV